MLLMAALSALGLLIDDRVVVGDPVWLKPFKFSVSFALYGVTLAWMLSLRTSHPPSTRLPGGISRRLTALGGAAGTAIVIAGSVEMAIIVSAAALGRRSHFNVATDLERLLFALMGLTIIVLWVATLVIALLLLRERLREPAEAWALRLGALTALVGLALGGLMLTPTPEQASGEISGVLGAHSVGVPDGGPGMPLTGWSTVGGDLRIPHFVGMHALQLLPLLVPCLRLAARRLPRLRDTGVRLRLTLVAAGGYSCVVLLVTWQALRGQPLVRPDTLTLTAWTALAVATLAATALALRPTPRSRTTTPEAVR
ncbi:hypothetical protein H3146_26280 [Streptomyces sp. OF3]|uniref:Uncharacterized protein n=3 Tax=Streptomyces alkaliterrae TaxID=2213162 RepID=A0A5P0YZN0_9ACTN|nr:hypothetical protein [Streptomyces alkaliterrae]MBB1262349.1 hypothetical protein [Streptomyces alkaliterrae]MQS05177.1 hypothetical protein [Streptomyces alkaliterrae]